MRILFIDGYGVVLGARNGALAVRSQGKTRVVPLGEVDVVVVATSGVSVTSKAVRLMARAGVELVFLDSRGDPVAITYPPALSRTVETRRAQYEALHRPQAVQVAAEMAAAKVHNQALHLRRLAARRGERWLAEAAAAVEEAEAEILEAPSRFESVEEARGYIMGVEARAAREYWSALARTLPGELGFTGRDRDAGDPVNAVLNYAYGMLYALAWRALVLAGLDPYAGFLHVDRSGKPVLAFDYVEMWRPVLVDAPVAAEIHRGWRPSLNEGLLPAEERRKTARLVKDRLVRPCHGGFRRMTCEEALRSYALRLARALRSGSGYEAYRGW